MVDGFHLLEQVLVASWKQVSSCARFPRLPSHPHLGCPRTGHWRGRASAKGAAAGDTGDTGPFILSTSNFVEPESSPRWRTAAAGTSVLAKTDHTLLRLLFHVCPCMVFSLSGPSRRENEDHPIVPWNTLPLPTPAWAYAFGKFICLLQGRNDSFGILSSEANFLWT